MGAEEVSAGAAESLNPVKRVKGKLAGLGQGDRELGAAEHFLREAQTVGGWEGGWGAVGGVLAAGGV